MSTSLRSAYPISSRWRGRLAGWAAGLAAAGAVIYSVASFPLETALDPKTAEVAPGVPGPASATTVTGTTTTTRPAGPAPDAPHLTAAGR